MSDGELDLTGSKPARSRSSSSSSGKRPSGAQQRAKARKGLGDRIAEVFDRIGGVLLKRGDEELGAAFVEEQEPMAQGLVNLTRRVPAAKAPVLIGLELVEPFLAFGRVLSILFRRARGAREQAFEAAAEYAEMEAAAAAAGLSVEEWIAQQNGMAAPEPAPA